MNPWWLLAWWLVLFPAQSWAQSIHVEWGYTPPSAPAVTGFKLYQEGAHVCQWPGETVTSGDCDAPITKVSTGFTLTAVFNDGTESPHSAVFTLILPAGVPVIKSIIIK